MGKITASYLVRIVLREPDETDKPKRELKPLTNAALEGIIGRVLYDETNHYADEINVTSQRTDK